jgi:hypothetical protein
LIKILTKRISSLRADSLNLNNYLVPGTALLESHQQVKEGTGRDLIKTEFQVADL